MCHLSAQNAIERIFEILKHHFCILLLLSEFSIEVQAQIPSVLYTIHNFISVYNPAEDNEMDNSDETDGDNEYVADTDFLAADSDNAAGQMWDQIADVMWVDYQ